MVVLLVILALVPGMVIAGRLCFWALQPIQVPADVRHSRHQVRLSDVFALFVMVQVPLPLVLHLLSDKEAPVVVQAVMALLTTLVTGYVWYRGVQYLSSIGLESQWRRSIYLVIVLPLSLVATTVLIGWLFAFIAMLNGHVFGVLLIGIAAVVLLACGLASRALIRPEVEDASPFEPPTDEVN